MYLIPIPTSHACQVYFMRFKDKGEFGTLSTFITPEREAVVQRTSTVEKVDESGAVIQSKGIKVDTTVPCQVSMYTPKYGGVDTSDAALSYPRAPSSRCSCRSRSATAPSTTWSSRVGSCPRQRVCEGRECPLLQTRVVSVVSSSWASPWRRPQPARAVAS